MWAEGAISLKMPLGFNLKAAVTRGRFGETSLPIPTFWRNVPTNSLVLGRAISPKAPIRLMPKAAATCGRFGETSLPIPAYSAKRISLRGGHRHSAVELSFGQREHDDFVDECSACTPRRQLKSRCPEWRKVFGVSN